MEEWIRKRRSGEEERVLIADEQVSRGWECSHVLVVDLSLSGSGLENLVMRTVGYCALVKTAPSEDSDRVKYLEWKTCQDYAVLLRSLKRAERNLLEQY